MSLFLTTLSNPQMLKNRRQPDWLVKATSVIEKAIKAESRVALFFSGGAESLMLLHLLEPWRHKVTVYTVRTGAEFPHMVEFIDRKLEGWDKRVVAADLHKSFRELGVPASAVPIEHLQGISGMIGGEDRLPRIAPWPFCCVRNRWLPGCEAVKADGFNIAVHGQRSSDFPNGTKARLEHPGLELVTPLWPVSRAKVLAAAGNLGLELPDHYSLYPSSLDCSVCPASLTTQRRAWMATRYPKELAAAESLQAEVRAAVVAALDGDNTRGPFVPR